MKAKNKKEKIGFKPGYLSRNKNQSPTTGIPSAKKDIRQIHEITSNTNIMNLTEILTLSGIITNILVVIGGFIRLERRLTTIEVNMSHMMSGRLKVIKFVPPPASGEELGAISK